MIILYVFLISFIEDGNESFVTIAFFSSRRVGSYLIALNVPCGKLTSGQGHVVTQVD